MLHEVGPRPRRTRTLTVVYREDSITHDSGGLQHLTAGYRVREVGIFDERFLRAKCVFPSVSLA